MSEEREYGLEDGYNDGVAGDKPKHNLNVEHDDEYEAAYVDGYQRGAAERTETAAT